MRIAYLTGRYPATSHTFIHREIDALRARGADVHPFSIWRTDDTELLTPGDREEAERTWPVLPLRPLNTVRAHLRALRAGPAAYAAAVARAVALGRPGLRGRLLGLSWLLEAV